MTNRKSGLGRGLDALIPTDLDEVTAGFSQLELGKITANPDQPRSRFDDGDLEELAASIKELGVLQPIVVEEESGGYRLIAGERRLRAAKRAGLTTIPAVIRESSGEHTLIEALVENLQRSDLTPMEQARAYSRLLEEYGMTQDAVAKRVGKSRPAVSNTLRLLQLPSEIQNLLEEGELSEGHARALVGMDDEKYARYLAEKAASDGWSVRQVEEAARNRREMGDDDKGSGTLRTIRPVEIIELEKRLGEKLSARVKISYSNQRGRVEIKFTSVGELERLYRAITD